MDCSILSVWYVGVLSVHHWCNNCCHLIDCPFYRSSTYCVIMCWLILWTVLKLMPILRIWCDAYIFCKNLIPNSTVYYNPYKFSYKYYCAVIYIGKQCQCTYNVHPTIKSVVITTVDSHVSNLSWPFIVLFHKLCYFTYSTENCWTILHRHYVSTSIIGKSHVIQGITGIKYKVP